MEYRKPTEAEHKKICGIMEKRQANQQKWAWVIRFFLIVLGIALMFVKSQDFKIVFIVLGLNLITFGLFSFLLIGSFNDELKEFLDGKYCVKNGTIYKTEAHWSYLDFPHLYLTASVKDENGKELESVVLYDMGIQAQTPITMVYRERDKSFVDGLPNLLGNA